MYSVTAEIAQSVEHQLPKLRVAGSNPVFRSRGGGQAETLIESKNPCISLIYKDFFFALNHTARGLPLESPYCVYVDEQNNSIGSNRKEKDTVNA